LGNAQCVKNDYQAAISSYESALELDPKNAPALYNLGNALYMIYKYEEAVQCYLKAL
jgi:tetratricopeptide (TPR) repeat protein